MPGVSVLRGGPVRRPSQTLVADLPESEITPPSPELIAAIKRHDHDAIRRLTTHERSTT